jgi:ABC-type maltose transport system permease subunit
MMAAATLAAIPVTLAFLLFQKYIIKGISLTGLAGR